ncbi:molybdate ABC transporter permease subunit, partial [Myxococcota bacterium]|nr:molybdate ABC transporter permease subunit [Myxococcota bacterium]
MRTLSRASWDAALFVVGGLLLVLLALPIVALFGTLAPSDVGAGLASPVVWPALRLSLFTTTISLTIVVVTGAPLAWLLARSPRRAARAIETFVQLPAVIPPAVAGVALLLAFGRKGLLAPITPDGWGISFTTAAVVLAETFVSAPFFLQA